jgi:antitoxin YefM
MKTATVTGFRQKMKEHLNEIQDDQDILILTGPKKMEFVVLTLDAYNAMEETVYLLSTPANTERLLKSVAQDKAGNATVRHLDLGEEKQSSRKKVTRKITKATSIRRGR